VSKFAFKCKLHRYTVALLYNVTWMPKPSKAYAASKVPKLPKAVRAAAANVPLMTILMTAGAYHCLQSSTAYNRLRLISAVLKPLYYH
jgi:hypothetical protein